MPGLNRILKSVMNRYREVGSTYREIHDIRFYIRRLQLEHEILHSNRKGITSNQYGDSEIIVSLTTYGRRLRDVCYTIESLMQQTSLANRIVLWLDPVTISQQLPVALKKQMERGLEIHETPDIRSYKKLIPALIRYPNAAIITVDDDVIYDFDFIENMISSYKTAPHDIHACRVHSMEFDTKGNLLPYNMWKFCQSIVTNRNFLTGVGGVLYPPYSLHNEVLNKQAFTTICPTADDVWFTAMAKLNGRQIIKIQTRNSNGQDYLENSSVQDMGLCNINTGKNGKNDEQIKAVFTKYGIYDLIR